jgi:hypothetical protein
MARSVILYELNEVPWEIVDLYISDRPSSHLATLVAEGLCRTTVNEDPVPLQPWRTWPTFHKSMYTAEHNSVDLGQDPSSFRGEALWDVVEAAGRPVGLFGPMQSWPCRRFRSGGFYVPDTFSRSSETEPRSLQRFQAFNLAMTAENSFASDAPIGFREPVLAGVDLLTKGLTPMSAAEIVVHLAREKKDTRHKGARSVLQALPSFDLFWRLHKKHTPALSVFFTNHVAGMMHRYWGDGVPGYSEAHDYAVDRIYGQFVTRAMDLFDRQLGRIQSYVATHPDTVLIVAASMGQGPIEYLEIRQTYVLHDAARLISALALEGAEPGLAMYPRVSLRLPSPAAAEAAIEPITSVTSPLGPMFHDVRVHGTTISFEINYEYAANDLPSKVTYRPAGGGTPIDADVADLGVIVRSRPGGGNTAYHVPEGMLLAWGGGISPDPSRQACSVLDAAPSILSLLGLPPAPSMTGGDDMFKLRTSQH